MRRRVPSTRQRGFLLAATIWLLAILTVGASVLAVWTEQAREAALQNDREIDREIGYQSTFNELLYLAAANYMTEAGLSYGEVDARVIRRALDPFAAGEAVFPAHSIRLDDHPYVGFGDIRFAVQDVSGLVPINVEQPVALDALLGILGVSAGARSGLIQKLEDYRDLDDLHRPNGAEASHYRRAGLSGPTNRDFRTSYELHEVLDWAGQKALWGDPGIARLTNSTWNAMPNFNTAPLKVLLIWPGVGLAEAERVIAARQVRPFLDVKDIDRAVGHSLGLDPLEIGFFPSRYLRVSLWEAGSPGMREVLLQLTPNADGGRPWVVEYSVRNKLPQALAEGEAEPLADESFSFEAE